MGLVIFDEFHERSLQADLGLALTLDTQANLAPDLRVLVMSATLDAQGIAQRLGNAPVVQSAGRTFRWRRATPDSVRRCSQVRDRVSPSKPW